MLVSVWVSFVLPNQVVKPLMSLKDAVDRHDLATLELRGLPNLHAAIRLREGLGDNRFRPIKGPQHVHVLRALARVKERNLGCRTLPAKDALRPQSLPDWGLIGIQGFERVG